MEPIERCGVPRYWLGDWRCVDHADDESEVADDESKRGVSPRWRS